MLFAKIGFDTAENEPSKFWPSSLAHPLLGHITARGRLLLLEEVRELRAERAELGLRRRGPVGLLAEPREVVLQRGLGGAAIDPWCGAAGKEESIPNFRFPFLSMSENE